MLLPSGNPIKCHAEALSVQPMKQYIITIPCLMIYNYIVSVLFFLFVWCPCVAINKCTVQRWASPRRYTVDPMLLPTGIRLNAMKSFFLSLQPMIPPKRSDISPPDWEMLRRFRRVLIFLETTRSLMFEEKSECVSQVTVGSDLFQGKSKRI